MDGCALEQLGEVRCQDKGATTPEERARTVFCGLSGRCRSNVQHVDAIDGVGSRQDSISLVVMHDGSRSSPSCFEILTMPH
jgi:hypothetical protein